MNLDDYKAKKEEFFVYLSVERNVSDHTLRAYQSDLNAFTSFWEKLNDDDKRHLSFRQIIEKYLVSLFYQKIDKSSIARKFSCFTSFERFLHTQGIILDLKLKRPRPDKKLPMYLSVDEIFHLLDAVKDEDLPSRRPARDKAIFELLYATGMRCSELVAIKIHGCYLPNQSDDILCIVC